MTSSWRMPLVVSVIVHVAIISVLLLSPRLSPLRPATNVSPTSTTASAPPDSQGSMPPRVERIQRGAPRAASARGSTGTPLAATSARAVPAASRGVPATSRGPAPENLDGKLEPVEVEIEQAGAQHPSARATLEFVGNHLWQSTLCLAVAALLTLMLRRGRARVRHAVWATASAKFLVPFAPLIALGRQIGWRTADAAARSGNVTVVMDTISHPFSRATSGNAAVALPAAHSVDLVAMLPLLLLAIWAIGSIAVLLTWYVGWRRLAIIVRRSTVIRGGRELEILRRLERRTGITAPTGPVASNTSLEPGVFGLTKPVLLWPRDIAGRLTEGQIETLLAHEICHIRRQDNLLAALHMVVEALFWFHPLVWWLETRLVDERERACDEDVVRLGHDPVVYAEGILKTCQFYAETPLTCVTGVTGSDLKKRIEAIMRNRASEALGPWRRLLLATAGITILAAPVVVGAMNAPLRQQSPGTPSAAPASAAPLPQFEAASVKQNKSGAPGWRLEFMPGGRVAGTNASVASIVRLVYDLPAFLVFGGPDWLESQRFDIAAKATDDAPVDQKRLMLRRLLNERFKLTVHTEKRDLPYYALTMNRADGRLGPRLRRADFDCTRVVESTDPGIGPPLRNEMPGCGFFGFSANTDFAAGRGGISFRGVSMPALAKIFVPMLRRSVIDQTGLAGYYDADFDFIAELPIPPPPPGVPPAQFEAPFVSVFTVLPEQLGLKLDSRRGPVEVLVIDRAEAPTPD